MGADVYRGLGKFVGGQKVGYVDDNGDVYHGLGKFVGGTKVGYVDANGDVYDSGGKFGGKKVGLVDDGVNRVLRGGGALLLLLT